MSTLDIIVALFQETIRENEGIIKELKQQVALLSKTGPEKKQQREKRVNTLGLNVIDGGEKLEEQSPFAN